MTRQTPDRIVRALLARHGETFGGEIGIAPDGSATSLFQLVCAAILFGAPVPSVCATNGARALLERGWLTPQKMAASSGRARAAVLRRGGYARWAGRAAALVGDAASMICDEYGGDVRALRDEAERNPERERALLKRLPGIGDVAADIFFRETQAHWRECAPFVDARALAGAKRLRLGSTPRAVAALVPTKRLPSLACALVRAELARDHAEIVAAARA